MKYRVVYKKPAERQLYRLPPSMQDRVVDAVRRLADDPRPHGSAKLAGSAAYRIRVGTYRVIYEIEDRIVTVLIVRIGHRRDIYR